MMPDGFISMREWLAPPVAAAPELPASEPTVPDSLDVLERPYDCADVRRFRAALEDALAVATDALLREIACDVLGRELSVACDIAALVRRAIERYGCEPLRVCVHPDEAGAARACGFPVEVDPALRRGDAVLVVESGTIDVRLGVRLSRVLETMMQ